MKNLKLEQYDIALAVGFVFCCIAIGFMAWSVNV